MEEEGTTDISTVTATPGTEGPDPNTTVPGVELQVNSPVLLPLTVVLTIVGVLTNALTVAVMLHKDSRKLPVSRLLLVLAVADSVCLLSDLTKIREIALFFGADLSPWTCRIIFWFRRTGGLVAHWLIVVVSVERLIAVFFYLRAKSICTVRNMTIVIVSIITIFVIYVSSYDHQMSFNNCVAAPGGGAAKILARIFGMMYIVVPIPLLALLNTSTAIRLCVRSEGDKKHLNLTIMLLCVTGLFVVLTLPTILTMPSSLPRNHPARQIAQLLITLNHSSNFFVYVLVGKRFRRNMRDMVSQRNLVGPGSSSGATTSNNRRDANRSTKLTATTNV